MDFLFGFGFFGIFPLESTLYSSFSSYLQSMGIRLRILGFLRVVIRFPVIVRRILK